MSTAGSALAQHRLVLTNGQVREGEVVGATPGNVQLKIAQGTIGIPTGTVARIEMPVPGAYTKAVAAWEAGDAATALSLIRPMVETFKGLPTDWAQQSAGLLGDIYLAANKETEAATAYGEFLKLYPAAGSMRTDVGLARIAVSKKQFAAARTKLEPVAAKAMEAKAVSKIDGAIYGQVFYLLGQINESEQKYQEALEDYLRAVTIFYYDAAVVKSAKEKADALRVDHPVHVP